MTVPEFCSWLEGTALAQGVSESTWLFPTIETIHVLAIALVVGSIAMVDLRLMDLISRERAIGDVLADALPWTWGSFVVAALSGAALFTSKAATYWLNGPFKWKLLLLLLAGLNMALFHALTYPRLLTEERRSPPLRARCAGAASLIIWLSIVTLGRWIGFVQ